MSAVDRIRSVVSRIRWRSVLAVLLFVAVLAVLFTSFPTGYSIGGGMGLKVKANPDRIKPGGTATLETELKNVRADENIVVTIHAKTYDSDLVFEESYSQEYESLDIAIGPEGVRKTSFRVKCKPTAYEGRYPIDVYASAEGEDRQAETRVFVTVEE